MKENYMQNNNAPHPVGKNEKIFEERCKEDRVRISTGIFSLDISLNGGLADELYIVGAESSSGKSAFLMSVAQNVAETGVDVLYFSLEMKEREFIARGISSISYEHYRKGETGRLVTAADILYWAYDTKQKDFTRVDYSQYEQYKKEYFERYGTHLYIIDDANNNRTVEDIVRTATNFKRDSGRPVAVFIDYLQQIRADPNDRSQSDRKTKMDVCVNELKNLASCGMPVVAISSVSRNGYGKEIGTSSFKESGDIEYTGGILIGWNWIGVTDQGDKAKNKEEKERCEERGYRRMRADVLKNRNAERDGSAYLKYYPAYNFFEECKEEKPVKDKDMPSKKKYSSVF